MSEAHFTIDSLEQRLAAGPFNRWLGFKVLKMDDSGLELKATWREEWVVNPERRYTHGGILAAIIDVAADYAIAVAIGRPVPTIDIRVDYHKAAMPGDLIAKAKVVRMGTQYATAEAYVYDQEGALVASGRGTYYTAPPPPPKQKPCINATVGHFKSAKRFMARCPRRSKTKASAGSFSGINSLTSAPAIKPFGLSDNTITPRGSS